MLHCVYSFMILLRYTTQHMSPPASPATGIERSPQQPSSTPKKRIGPSALRNFHLSFRSSVPAIPAPGEPSGSRNSSRLSLFRSPRRSTSTIRSHNKSSSLSTLNLAPQGISSEDPARPSTSQSSSWRWRSHVRSHFSRSPSVPRIHVLDYESHAPRASVSSTNTSVLTPPATYDDDPDFLSTPSKTVHLNSVRSRGKSPTRPLFQNGSTASVPSLWSGPTSISHTPETSGSTTALAHKESAIRIPFSPKSKHLQLTPTSTISDAPAPVESQGPQIVYPSTAKGGSVPRASLSSLSSPREKRKKKLVVSGIGVNEPGRLDAMKKWCESFGEVTHIMRMPNGDLHVHFRKAEVAETVRSFMPFALIRAHISVQVCRVRARVHISGVGSVQLSWLTGDKR
jgi:hypothetical protein